MQSLHVIIHCLPSRVAVRSAYFTVLVLVYTVLPNLRIMLAGHAGHAPDRVKLDFKHSLQYNWQCYSDG
jgi:hypothetical protein